MHDGEKRVSTTGLKWQIYRVARPESRVRFLAAMFYEQTSRLSFVNMTGVVRSAGLLVSRFAQCFQAEMV